MPTDFPRFLLAVMVVLIGINVLERLDPSIAMPAVGLLLLSIFVYNDVGSKMAS